MGASMPRDGRGESALQLPGCSRLTAAAVQAAASGSPSTAVRVPPASAPRKSAAGTLQRFFAAHSTAACQRGASPPTGRPQT